MGSSSIHITDEGFKFLEKVIQEAEKYIKFASFLFYDETLCDLLIKTIQTRRIEIELLTTPAEAAESDDLKKTSAYIQSRLRHSGVSIVPCDWEVGQPELTTSTRAGGRVPKWFAMHAKYMITDKCALITSADITQTFSNDHDWNTFVVHRSRERIQSLLEEYERLKHFFSNVSSYVPSEYIDSAVSPRNLIRGYPPGIIPKPQVLKDGFYILPIEGYGREIIRRAIEGAQAFVYLMFETVFDDEVAQFFMRKLISSPQMDFRIITSPLAEYVQNPAKARASFVQLASYGAKMRTLTDLRGKMLVTDKTLLAGSFDLTKMGIGTMRSIRKGIRGIVASTEILDANSDIGLIGEAKARFLQVFQGAREEYGLWFMKDAERILRSVGAVIVAKDAKELLGHIMFNEMKKPTDRVKRISYIAVEIAKTRSTSSPYVKAGDVQKAEQVLILHDGNELEEESLGRILEISDVRSLLEKLEANGILTRNQAPR